MSDGPRHGAAPLPASGKGLGKAGHPIEGRGANGRHFATPEQLASHPRTGPETTESTTGMHNVRLEWLAPPPNLPRMHIRATLRGLVAPCLRWQKPSGRLILFDPAGWSLWPAARGASGGRPRRLIGLGALAVSGAAVSPYDLWARRHRRLWVEAHQGPTSPVVGECGQRRRSARVLPAAGPAVVGHAFAGRRRGAALLLPPGDLAGVLALSLCQTLVFGFSPSCCWPSAGVRGADPRAAAIPVRFAGGWPPGTGLGGQHCWDPSLLTRCTHGRSARMNCALGLRSKCAQPRACAPAVVAICYGLTALFLALAALLQGGVLPSLAVWVPGRRCATATNGAVCLRRA